jgi:uroporphyrinogen-III decarboxylase
MNTTIALDKDFVAEVTPYPGRPDGYTQFSAALFGETDRIPVIVQPGLYAMALRGLSSRRFFCEAETFIHASHNMAAYFGFDGWAPIFDANNIEAEALGQPLVWREGIAPWVDGDHLLLRERADLDRLTPPIPGQGGRMPFVLESYQRFAELIRTAPVCACCAPFILAAQLRGTKTLIMDMYRDPGFVDRLLTFLSQEVVVPWIRKLIEDTGASAVVMWDAEARPPIMSPSLIRRFCLPHVEAVIQATRSAACTVIDAAAWGEEQVADHGETLEIKAYAGRQNVDRVLNLQSDTFRADSAGQVVDAVCRLLEEGEQDGSAVLLINHIPVGTPVDLVHAAVAAVKQFGRYPIAERLPRQAFRIPATVLFQQWMRRMVRRSDARRGSASDATAA